MVTIILAGDNWEWKIPQKQQMLILFSPFYFLNRKTLSSGTGLKEQILQKSKKKTKIRWQHSHWSCYFSLKISLSSCCNAEKGALTWSSATTYSTCPWGTQARTGQWIRSFTRKRYHPHTCNTAPDRGISYCSSWNQLWRHTFVDWDQPQDIFCIIIQK